MFSGARSEGFWVILSLNPCQLLLHQVQTPRFILQTSTHVHDPGTVLLAQVPISKPINFITVHLNMFGPHSHDIEVWPITLKYDIIFL